jgi:hypothetical protein
MTYENALRFQKILTDTFLFSKRRVLVLSGDDDGDDVTEKLADIFDCIDGIGISLERETQRDFYLQFYVTKKIDPYMNPRQTLATYLGVEGHEIRLIDSKPFRILSGPKVLGIGHSVGHITAEEFGTLGCFVKDPAGKKYLLSNYHVLYNPKSALGNDFVIQPARPHGGAQPDIVGVMGAHVRVDPAITNYFDAAIAGPIGDGVDLNLENPCMKAAIRGHAKARLNMNVSKFGAASGRTRGTISALNVNAKVTVFNRKVEFANQIMVQNEEKGYLLAGPGDSGSVFVDDDKNAVGLLFAGNGPQCLANHLDDLLLKLGVQLVVQ